MLRNLNRSYSGRRIAGTPFVGVLASAIPTTGDYPALGRNDIDPGDPAGCLYRTQILTWPLGDLRVDENTSFIYTPPSPDFVGTVRGTQRVWKMGAVAYDETFSFTYGSPASVSSDLVGTYAVRAHVGADFISTYGVRQLVGASLSATYAIRALVGANLTATYAIATATGLPMSFTPSAARTVTVEPGVKPFSAGTLWTMSDPKKPRTVKDGDSLIDYSFNWAPWLLDVVDTITGHEILLTEGLVSEGSAAVGGKVTVFVSGGTANKRASITCRITTGSTPPRVEDRTIYLDIEAA